MELGELLHHRVDRLQFAAVLLLGVVEVDGDPQGDGGDADCGCGSDCGHRDRRSLVPLHPRWRWLMAR